MLVPMTVLRLTWVLALSLGNLSAWLLIQKQPDGAELVARLSCSINAWWFNLFRLAGKDAPAISFRYLKSLILVATSLMARGKVDEEIEIRKQIVELASSSDYFCDAAKSCDFLAWLHRKKKDIVHSKHWAERAIGYYERLDNDVCACRKQEHNLHGKLASLEAWFAKDLLREGFLPAAEMRAQKALALIGKCSDDEADLAMMRLMDFFFDSKDWKNFEPIANRYIAIRHPETDKTKMYVAGQALIRLGTIYGATPDKYPQAETALLSGIEYAKKSGRDGLLTKGQSALAALQKGH